MANDIEQLVHDRIHSRCRCVVEPNGTLDIQLQAGDRSLTVVGIDRQELCDEQSVHRLADLLLEEMQVLVHPDAEPAVQEGAFHVPVSRTG